MEVNMIFDLGMVDMEEAQIFVDATIAAVGMDEEKVNTMIVEVAGMEVNMTFDLGVVEEAEAELFVNEVMEAVNVDPEKILYSIVAGSRTFMEFLEEVGGNEELFSFEYYIEEFEAMEDSYCKIEGDPRLMLATVRELRGQAGLIYDLIGEWYMSDTNEITFEEFGNMVAWIKDIRKDLDTAVETWELEVKDADEEECRMIQEEIDKAIEAAIEGKLDDKQLQEIRDLCRNVDDWEI